MNKILNRAKMYVIGDRDSGIVMIKTNPVKIFRIPERRSRITDKPAR